MADFGLSRVCDEALVETKTYGTVTHMPPELLLEGKLSKSADVYAYGVLLFELFTADRPWGGLRHAEVLHKVAVKHERLQLPADTPQLFQVRQCQLKHYLLTPDAHYSKHNVAPHKQDLCRHHVIVLSF